MKQFLFFILSFLFSASTISAQEKPQISVDKVTHNFGQIKEEGGAVEHVFVVKNTGKNPLVIDRITTSCGCTLPEWSKEPVPPGGTKDIKIWYDPDGRPGRFTKTISVYSNAEPRRFVMTIEGDVERRPSPAQLRNYPYSIGDLKLLSKTVSYNAIRINDTLGEKIEVKNSGEKNITLRFEGLPTYLTAEARPLILRPNEIGEIVFLLNAKGIGKKGRYHTSIPLKVQPEGETAVVQPISLSANVVDDFSKLSATDKAKAPVAYLASTLMDFGKIEDKSSILGLGGKETRTFEITNNGKLTLHIYSVTSDDQIIDISGGKKELKPNSSATFKVIIRPKDFKVKLESTITVVCNDPNGPVRLIKVTAEK